MTQIFLVRHGQSEGNLFRRVQGQTDVELTADGKAAHTHAFRPEEFRK